jgi:hypothetical protein
VAGEKDTLRFCGQPEFLRVGVERSALRVIDVDIGLISAVEHPLVDDAIGPAIDHLLGVCAMRNHSDHLDWRARDDSAELHSACDRIKNSRSGHSYFLSAIELK